MQKLAGLNFEKFIVWSEGQEGSMACVWWNRKEIGHKKTSTCTIMYVYCVGIFLVHFISGGASDACLL